MMTALKIRRTNGIKMTLGNKKIYYCPLKLEGGSIVSLEHC